MDDYPDGSGMTDMADMAEIAEVAEMAEMQAYVRVLNWWKVQTASAEGLEEALEWFNVSFDFHSGRIENVALTLSDVEEAFAGGSLEPFSGSERTRYEILGARAAYGLLVESLREQRTFDEALVKQFHRALAGHTYDQTRYDLGERPGAYKVHNFVTGRHDTGSSAVEVTEEMQELLSELTEIPKPHILTAAAYYHVRFESIHPFADGNGHCGRLTMNYYLLAGGHPPVIVHEDDREAYYAALEAWDLQQVLIPMENFLRGQTVRSWRNLVNLAQFN